MNSSGAKAQRFHSQGAAACFPCRNSVPAGVPIAAFGCPETQEAFGSLRIISNELIIGIK